MQFIYAIYYYYSGKISINTWSMLYSYMCQILFKKRDNQTL